MGGAAGHPTPPSTSEFNAAQLLPWCSSGSTALAGAAWLCPFHHASLLSCLHHRMPLSKAPRSRHPNPMIVCNDRGPAVSAPRAHCLSSDASARLRVKYDCGGKARQLSVVLLLFLQCMQASPPAPCSAIPPPQHPTPSRAARSAQRRTGRPRYPTPRANAPAGARPLRSPPAAALAATAAAPAAAAGLWACLCPPG
jgi:hypothetical protein